MKRMDFKLPIYNWNITIVTIYDKHDEESIKKLFDEFEIDDSDAIENVVEERYNGGETYVNRAHREAVIVIYKFDSMSAFYNVLGHEKRHLVDRIAQTHYIRDEFEAVAYLDGYISEQIFSDVMLG